MKVGSRNSGEQAFGPFRPAQWDFPPIPPAKYCGGTHELDGFIAERESQGEMSPVRGARQKIEVQAGRLLRTRMPILFTFREAAMPT